MLKVGLSALKDKLLQNYDGDSVSQKLTSLEKAAEGLKQALTIGADALPVEFKRDVFLALRDVSVMRNICRSTTMNARDSKMVSVNGAVANYSEIGYSRTETAITFGSVSLQARGISCFSPINREDIADLTNIDTYTQIVSDFAEAIAEFEDKEFINGQGAALPNATQNAITGIIRKLIANYAPTVAFATGDATDAGHAITYTAGSLIDNLVALERIVLESGAKEKDLVWLLSHKAYELFSAEVDTQGRPLVRADLINNGPKTILGYPVVRTSHVPKDLGVSSDETVAILGAFPKYAIIGTRADLEIRESEHFNFDKNQLTVHLEERVDFAVGKTTPFALIGSIK